MIWITNLDSAEQIVRYYSKKHTLESYYSENQEFNGYWGGNASKLLGVEGYITDAGLERLANNLHPQTGEQLTARMRSDRRPGFDLTFDVPKSVSLAYAFSKDDRIIKVVRQAAHRIAEMMEADAAARVRAGLGKNADEDRTTGNFCSAEFVHLTARPVDGYSDPHVHVHLVVFNMTFDPVEKKWKALQLGNIHDEIQYYQEAYHTLLREGLQALGLGIVPTEQNFEIEGIHRDLVEIFSRRTKTIEETAARLGITDPAQKAKLGAMTRDKKDKAVLMTDLDPFWWGGLSPEHREALEGVAALLKRTKAMELSQQLLSATVKPPGLDKASEALGLGKEFKSTFTPGRESVNQRTRPGATVESLAAPTAHDRQAVALAIKHVFERQSVVSEKELTAEAFRNWRVGRTTFHGIQQVVKEAPLLRMQRGGKLFVTTAEIQAEEERLRDRCLAGKGIYDPLNKFWKIEDEKLNAEQRAAVETILNCRDWVMGISGKAGTGKTRLLNELRQGLEAGLNQVYAFAPSSKAARESLRNEGFKNAETVAKLLVSEELQRQARGAVWLVDEAGLLSTRQADQLFELAQRLEARLVMIGDTGQHHGVERGQAFDLLERFGKMTTVKVTKVMRQRGSYREFVELVSEGRIPEAFAVKGVQGNLIQMKFQARMEALAADYVDARERGKTALVVAPTHAECNAVAESIRQKLKEKGVLGESTQWSVLRDQYWSEAERSDGDKYRKRKNLVVQLNKHFKGFSLGEKLEVLEGDVKGLTKEERAEVFKNRDGMVRVRSKITYFDRIKALPLGGAKHFNVYERENIEICAGERIRITANSRTAEGHRVSNGNEYTVEFIDVNGRLVLNNGWHLDKNFEHLEYAYTSTSHGAQGLTVDSVFVSQPSAQSACAGYLNQFYVAISRGRDEFKLYTDDLGLLQQMISRVRQRPMATELMQDRPEERLWEAEPVPMAEEVERDGREARASAALGKSKGIEWPAEQNAEIEKILKETEARGMERDNGMVMEMGM